MPAQGGRRRGKRRSTLSRVGQRGATGESAGPARAARLAAAEARLLLPASRVIRRVGVVGYPEPLRPDRQRFAAAARGRPVVFNRSASLCAHGCVLSPTEACFRLPPGRSAGTCAQAHRPPRSAPPASRGLASIRERAEHFLRAKPRLVSTWRSRVLSYGTLKSGSSSPELPGGGRSSSRSRRQVDPLRGRRRNRRSSRNDRHRHRFRIVGGGQLDWNALSPSALPGTSEHVPHWISTTVAGRDPAGRHHIRSAIFRNDRRNPARVHPRLAKAFRAIACGNCAHRCPAWTRPLHHDAAPPATVSRSALRVRRRCRKRLATSPACPPQTRNCETTPVPRRVRGLREGKASERQITPRRAVARKIIERLLWGRLRSLTPTPAVTAPPLAGITAAYSRCGFAASRLCATTLWRSSPAGSTSGTWCRAVWSTAATDIRSRMTDPHGDRSRGWRLTSTRSRSSFARCGWIWPSPIRCSSFQRSAVTASGSSAYWLARCKHLGSAHSALGFALAYLLYPATGWLTLNEFHPSHSRRLLLLFAFWHLPRRRPAPAHSRRWRSRLRHARRRSRSSSRLRHLVRALTQRWLARRGDRQACDRVSCRSAMASRSRTTTQARSPDFYGPLQRGRRLRRRHLEDCSSLILCASSRRPSSARDLHYLLALVAPALPRSAYSHQIDLVAALPELAINLLSSTTTQTSIHFHYTAGLIPPSDHRRDLRREAARAGCCRSAP